MEHVEKCNVATGQKKHSLKNGFEVSKQQSQHFLLNNII